MYLCASVTTHADDRDTEYASTGRVHSPSFETGTGLKSLRASARTAATHGTARWPDEPTGDPRAECSCMPVDLGVTWNAQMPSRVSSEPQPQLLASLLLHGDPGLASASDVDSSRSVLASSLPVSSMSRWS